MYAELTSAEHQVDRVKQPGQGASQVRMLKIGGTQQLKTSQTTPK